MYNQSSQSQAFTLCVYSSGFFQQPSTSLHIWTIHVYHFGLLGVVSSVHISTSKLINENWRTGWERCTLCKGSVTDSNEQIPEKHRGIDYIKPCTGAWSSMVDSRATSRLLVKSSHSLYNWNTWTKWAERNAHLATSSLTYIWPLFLLQKGGPFLKKLEDANINRYL